ncbi:metal ABC transporter substrate-binding protein [Haladaptatus cibarius]|uniref:metal ABC transporter substrate-binding protein n=1 Tax=Haladaptatus cibarius TaxID=453847 RepID=UPI000678FBF4|nr:metal ABC transporter substrate-binding protein [Haladaptatus cibarius]
MTNITRRRALKTGTALLVNGTIAGCLGSSAGDGSDDSTTVQTSFFVLTDFARNVVGDAANAESLVPVGQHGHGWEPSAQVQRDAMESDAVIYMGKGFQPWADRMVKNIEQDRPEITIVAARHGISLLPAPGHGDKHEGEEKHHEEENHGNETEHGHEEGDQHDKGEGGHDHGASDPHFWLDPQRANQAVSTIESGLSEMEGVSGESLAGNAEDFQNQLDELDSTFESELESTERNAVLVAGHNAFQYLGERYGFEIHALTGLAPDSSPSPKDVQRAQNIIEEHDITHVLAPVFESDRAAKQLVSETDAKDHLSITPIPSVTEEWNEKDWGYIEIMEEVNLPSLKTALGAK